MGVYEIKDKKKIERLFEGWQETMIWSCLQDCMGRAYADDSEHPGAAMIVIADFCFFAGAPDQELVRYKPMDCNSDFIIMISSGEEWEKLIERVYQGKAVKRERYAMKKEGNIFNQSELSEFVRKVQSAYELKLIDQALFEEVKETPWALDLCGNFPTWKEYEQHGLGIVALKKDVIVSGASSYTWYKEGIEIEIDTREDERRRGLALVCGAGLILECMKRNLYPSWDAQNQGSAALAEKLGYHFDHRYHAYEIWGW